VVTFGFAVTVAPVVGLNPVAFVQVYVVAPDAVKTVEVPAHMVALVAETVGPVTVTTMDEVPEHPAPLFHV